MVSVLGAIQVGKIPWIALMYALNNWETSLAVVWGIGFAIILFKNMRRWVKADASDGSIGKRDEEEIYRTIKDLARQRRPERLKETFTRTLFWLPLLAWTLGKKIASVIFYPILAYLDKEQKATIEKSKKEKPAEIKNPAAAVLPPVVLEEGVNATKCKCGFLVLNMSAHACNGSVPSSPVAARTVRCEDCEKMVPEDTSHVCEARLAAEGLVKCECGAVYKEEDDFDHVCPEEDVAISSVQCKDCQRSYDPTDEVHAATYCRGCTDVHCKKFNCGQVVKA